MTAFPSSSSAVPPPWLLGLITLLLFAVWSNSFIAIDELLGTGRAAGGVFDWRELIIARYGLVAICMAAYLAAARPGESLRLLGRSWARLVVLGVLAVPAYGVCLFVAQEHGVPPAIASLSTAAVPLFLMLLGGLCLKERIGPAKWLGFAVAAAGLGMIAASKDLGPQSLPYPVLVLIVLGAPLCWALYSVILKPMMRRESPLLVMFVCAALVGLPLLLGLDARLWEKLRGVGPDALGRREWLMLLYLVGPCTLFGFPVWNWLVKHLPASTVGFTVFLNPPLTFVFSFVLQGAIPTVLEVGGTAIVLLGIAIVVFLEGWVRGPLRRAGTGAGRSPGGGESACRAAGSRLVFGRRPDGGRERR